MYILLTVNILRHYICRIILNIVQGGHCTGMHCDLASCPTVEVSGPLDAGGTGRFQAEDDGRGYLLFHDV